MDLQMQWSLLSLSRRLWLFLPLLLLESGTAAQVAQPDRTPVISIPGALEPGGRFRGVVLEEVPEDEAESADCGEETCYRPAPAGTEVVMRWQGVVLAEEDEALGYTEIVEMVADDGSFTGEAPLVTGNHFCECFVREYVEMDGKGDRGVPVVQSEAQLIHSELISVPGRGVGQVGSTIEAMRGPRSLPRGEASVFRGTGMDEVSEMWARDLETGELVAGPGVGAQSYWELQTLPNHGMDSGRYDLLFENQAGELIEAPALPEVVVPEITLTGTSVLRPGQPGDLFVNVDLRGGEIVGGWAEAWTDDVGVIELLSTRVPVPPQGGTVTFPFQALSPGEFDIVVTLDVDGDPGTTVTLADTPPDSLVQSELTTWLSGEDDPSVTPVNDPSLTEDPTPPFTYESGQTVITPIETFLLTDGDGDPLPNTECEVVQVTEQGATVYSTTTDGQGRIIPQTVVMDGELTGGQVIEVASTIAMHVIEVPGRQWSPDKETDPVIFAGDPTIFAGDPTIPIGEGLPGQRPAGKECCCIAYLEVEWLQDLKVTIEDQDGNLAKGSGKLRKKGDTRPLTARDKEKNIILGCWHKLNIRVEDSSGNPIMIDKPTISCRDFKDVKPIRKDEIKKNATVDDVAKDVEVIVREVVPDPGAGKTRTKERNLLKITKVIKQSPCPVAPKPRPPIQIHGPWPRDNEKWDEKNLKTGEKKGGEYTGSGAIIGMLTDTRMLETRFGCRKACWVQTVRGEIRKFKKSEKCNEKQKDDLSNPKCWERVEGKTSWTNDNPDWPSKSRKIPRKTGDRYPRWCYQGQEESKAGKLMMTDGPHIRHDIAAKLFKKGDLLKRTTEFQTALVCLDPTKVLERFGWSIETIFLVGGKGRTITDPEGRKDWKTPEELGIRRLPLEMPDGWKDRPSKKEIQSRDEKPGDVEPPK